MLIKNEALEKIKTLVYKHTGIQLTEDKKIMITNRMNKLLGKHLEFNGSLEDFLAVVEQRYLEEFINVFTTNKTNFYREIQHFNFLFNEVFKTFNEKNNRIKIYCSASSTGEEVWSILGTYAERMKKDKKDNMRTNIELLATDIDTTILKKAKEAEYECKDVAKQVLPSWLAKETVFELPANKCRKEASTYNEYQKVKIKKELVQLANFRQMNLMDTEYSCVRDDYYDVVFCRNVLIYFSKEDQTKILKRLMKKLKVGGYLMLGHSESPLGIDSCLEKRNFNIFKKIK